MNIFLRIASKTIQSFKIIQKSLIVNKLNAQLNPEIWQIFTHTTEQERLLLYQLCSKLPSNNIAVEIGSYLGASTCFIAAGCKNKSGCVYAIDTWENQAMSEGLRDTYKEFLQNTSAYKDVITPIRSFSVNAAQDFSKAIDLLFIDGDHTYEGVIEDLKSWIPKLKPNAWLILHDTGWADGVNQAIKEVVEPISVGEPLTLPNLYAVRVDCREVKLLE